MDPCWKKTDLVSASRVIEFKMACRLGKKHVRAGLLEGRRVATNKVYFPFQALLFSVISSKPGGKTGGAFKPLFLFPAPDLGFMRLFLISRGESLKKDTPFL